MKLRHFKIENFRCLRAFEIDFDDFSILIGANNIGKSTVLRALDLFLSGTVRGINKDFFCNRETALPMILTATFEHLTDEELEKLGPWVVDEKLVVTKEYVMDAEEKVAVSYVALMKEPSAEWLSEDYSEYNNREILMTLPLSPYVPAGRLTKDTWRTLRTEYIENNKDVIEYHIARRKNPAGFKNVLDGYLPELILIPAVRDVSDDVKATPTTLLGKLISYALKRVQGNTPLMRKFQDAIQEVNRLIVGDEQNEKLPELVFIENSLKTYLNTWGVTVELDMKFPDLDKLFQLSTDLQVDDGFRSNIEYKGHGLQRSMIIALMRVWAQVSANAQGNVGGREKQFIFAIEEPELYLHPHLCRATYGSLKILSEDQQVILCTHSPYFVNMEDYKCIRVLRKQANGGKRCVQSNVDLFENPEEAKLRFKMISYFNPDRSELFFARKVILVEGATEKSVLPFMANKLALDNHDITVVDCGGKFNLTLFIQILNAFEIPHCVIHDEDPIPQELLPGGSGFHQDKYNSAKSVYDVNAEIEGSRGTFTLTIHKIPHNFERVLGVSDTRAQKLGKPFAAIRHYSEETNAIPESLKIIVEDMCS